MADKPKPTMQSRVSGSVAKALKSAGTPGPGEGKKKRKKAALAAPEANDPSVARREAAQQLATWIAVVGLEKKAERIEIIDISEKVDYADFLVLMSGRSDRQVQALASGVDDALRQRGHRAQGIEGLSQGHWVLVDFGDVIVHVFLDEARRYYDIESLWMDARRVPYDGAELPPPRPSLMPPPAAP